MELVDTTDLKSVGITSCRGSTPLFPIKNLKLVIKFLASLALVLFLLFHFSSSAFLAFLIGLWIGVFWGSWAIPKDTDNDS